MKKKEYDVYFEVPPREGMRESVADFLNGVNQSCVPSLISVCFLHYNETWFEIFFNVA